MKHILLLCCLLISISIVAVAQNDIFMKINEIKGESQDQKYKDAIEILSFAQESFVECSTAGGVANCSKTQTGNFAFDIRFGKANLGLRRYMYEGRVLPTVEIIFRKAGQNPIEYYKILLEDVFVVRLSESINESEQASQLELKATKATWTYTPQNINGSAGTPTSFKWNFATNTSN